jgi:hypothetical protein
MPRLQANAGTTSAWFTGESRYPLRQQDKHSQHCLDNPSRGLTASARCALSISAPTTDGPDAVACDAAIRR